MSEQNMNQAGGPPEGGFQPSPEFIQRVQRVEMAKALVEPDRVPFMPSMNNFYVYHYNKTTVKEWMEDCHSIIPSMDQYLKDYNPDLVWTPGMFPKNAMEIIGSNQCRWPGEYWNLPDNTAYQYVDKSFLGDDDWDEFFKDPTLFILRKVLPQKYKSLGALSMLNLYGICGHCVLSFMPFGLPPVQGAINSMLAAGAEVGKYMEGLVASEMFCVQNGYPTFGSSVLCCPFDDFADNVRGLMELCMDLTTDPELVDEALERWGDVTIPAAIQTAKMAHQNYVFIPLHCGVDNFMSVENYEKHYWPGLKRCIEELVKADLTPVIFCEGKYHTRLDVIKDVPRGKVIYCFEDVDMAEAKQKLGDVACIAMGMKTSTLMHKTPQEVEDEVKASMDILAPGGGYIMSNTVALDYVSPENMHAWRNAVEKYGKY